MNRDNRPVVRDSEEGLWKGIADGILVSSDFSSEGRLRLSHTVGSLPSSNLRQRSAVKPLPAPVPTVSPPGLRRLDVSPVIPRPRRLTEAVLTTTDTGTQTSDDKLKEALGKALSHNDVLERRVRAAERIVRMLALYSHDKENVTL
jgi:hypothetical protein